jgi:hypothetical protein
MTCAGSLTCLAGTRRIKDNGKTGRREIIALPVLLCSRKVLSDWQEIYKAACLRYLFLHSRTVIRVVAKISSYDG